MAPTPLPTEAAPQHSGRSVIMRLALATVVIASVASTAAFWARSSAILCAEREAGDEPAGNERQNLSSLPAAGALLRSSAIAETPPSPAPPPALSFSDVVPKPRSFAEYNLCAVGGGGQGVGGYQSPSCEGDPTCVSCVSDEAEMMAAAVHGAFYDEERRAARRRWLSERFGRPSADASLRGTVEGSVLVFMTDGGKFLDVLANWFCYDEAGPRLLQRSSLKPRVLIVAYEAEVWHWARAHGLHAVNITDYGLDKHADWNKLRNGAEVRITSGWKYGLLPVYADLLSLGLHVVYSDADSVWERDPLPLLLENPQLRHVDVVSQYAKRWDAQGPVSTGFLSLRPTPLVEALVEALVVTVAVSFRVDDQVMFNTMLRHHLFRQVTLRSLPDSVINEWSSRRRRRDPEGNDRDVRVFHFVGQGRGKKLNLMNLGGFLFHNASCSYFTGRAWDGRPR